MPTYQSEIAPAQLRGFLVGSIQLCLTFGSLIAGIVNQFLSTRTDNTGWQIATAIQVIPPVMIIALLQLTTLSPRWLASKDRHEEALHVLKRVRRQRDVDAGLCELELEAMKEEMQGGVTSKGPWKDLFNSKNIRRTGYAYSTIQSVGLANWLSRIACSIMSLQQLTGVTFSSSYGPTFYKTVGLSNMAFAYAVSFPPTRVEAFPCVRTRLLQDQAINNGVSVVTAMIAMVFLDRFGRRTMTFHGCWTQAVFLALIGALGSKSSPTSSETNGMVASFIIYAAILHATLGPAAYVTAAEVGTGALREKTMALSVSFPHESSFCPRLSKLTRALDCSQRGGELRCCIYDSLSLGHSCSQGSLYMDGIFGARLRVGLVLYARA